MTQSSIPYLDLSIFGMLGRFLQNESVKHHLKNACLEMARATHHVSSILADFGDTDLGRLFPQLGEAFHVMASRLESLTATQQQSESLLIESIISVLEEEAKALEGSNEETSNYRISALLSVRDILREQVTPPSPAKAAKRTKKAPKKMAKKSSAKGPVKRKRKTRG